MMLLFVAAAWSCEPLDLEVAKSNASARLAEGDALAALSIVRDAAGRLECTDSLADPVTLSLLFQVGVAAAVDEDLVRRELAADAIRFGPGVECRSLLGAATCQALDTARNAAETGPRGRVAAVGEVWLDGARLAAGAERTVAPGRHLVQHYDSNARVISQVVVVPADAPTQVGVATTPVAGDTAKRSPLRTPLAVGGATLGLLGGACVAVAFFDLYDDPSGDGLTEADNALYNPLVFGGLAALGVGAGLSVGSAFVGVGPGGIVLTHPL